MMSSPSPTSRRLLLATLVATALAAPTAARAADTGGDAPIYAVQNRAFHLRHEFHLGVGVLPINAFTKGITLGGGYTFHFAGTINGDQVDQKFSSGPNTFGDVEPADQLQTFELQVVNRLWELATPETAREIADRTWDMVHDRPDDDPVKQRVVECHEALARLTHLQD